jgi:hypothetical protein
VVVIKREYPANGKQARPVIEHRAQLICPVRL